MSPPTTKAEDTGAPPSFSPNKRPLQKSLPLSPAPRLRCYPARSHLPPLRGGRCRGATEGGAPQILMRLHSRPSSPSSTQNIHPDKINPTDTTQRSRMTKTTIPRSAFGPASGTPYPEPPSPRPILTRPQRSKHRPKSSKIDHNRPRSSTRRRNSQPTAANSLISLGIASALARQPRSRSPIPPPQALS